MSLITIVCHKNNKQIYDYFVNNVHSSNVNQSALPSLGTKLDDESLRIALGRDVIQFLKVNKT